MRILSLKGAHLTSLEAPFEVYLDREPLAHAGIFAITGPTGAGKSTLLDTICLALFNKSPRSADAGSILVGRENEEQINARDPRVHLRRGAPNGWAEVRFTGRDGRVYRSRWEVNRTQSNTLKPPTLTLFDEATNTPFPGNQTETLARIEERLGLNFEQFRRAVLLAQGEFAAFLRVDAHERAELLEKLTGQAIYSAISQLTFERSQEARNTFLALEKESESIEKQKLPLSQRLELKTRKSSIEAEIQQLGHVREEARFALDWYAQEQTLQSHVQEAAKNLEQAQQARQNQTTLQSDLDTAEQAEACRTAFSQHDSANHERKSAEQELFRRQQERIHATAELEASRNELQKAEQLFTQVQAEVSEFEQQVTQARSLDIQVAAAQRELSDVETQLSRARAERDKARQVFERTEQDMAQKRHDLLGIDQWLAARTELESFSQNASNHQKNLELLVQHREKSGLYSAEATGLQASASLLDSKQEKIEAEYNEELRRFEQLQQADEDWVDTTLLVQKQRELSQEQKSISETLARLEKLSQESSHIERLEQDLERTQADTQRAQETLVVGQQDLATTQILLKEARRTQTQLRAALDLSPLRETLIEGDPCPLCGATEHPWAHHAFAGKVLAPTDARVLELTEQEQSLLDAVGAARARLASCQEQAERLTGDLVDIREQAMERRRRFLEDTQLGPGAERQLQRRMDKIIEELVEIDEAYVLASRANELLRERQKELKSAQACLAEKEKRKEQHKKTTLEARVRAEAAVSSQQAAQARARELMAELPESLRALAEIEPTHALVRFRGDMAGFFKHREERRKAQDAVILGATSEETARVRLQEREAALKNLQSTVEGRRQVLVEIQQARQQLLHGLSVERVQHDVAQRRQVSEAARQQAALAVASQETRVSLALSQETAAQTRLEERQRQETIASQALGLALHGKSEALVRKALERGSDWIRQTREALTMAGKELEQWGYLLKEREANLAGWQTRRPMLSLEAAKQKMLWAGTHSQTLQSELAGTTQRILQDDQLGIRLSELSPSLTMARREHERWGTLSELIGSADGKSFRAFAQGLTLDVLLTYANENLAHLGPRYRLGRAPNPKKDARGDMNVQVIDLYMAGEVRPISSLSGGELFLTSLALALGLASLAGQRTRVETVFIDEGFGSLDARTLDAALSALEVLQSEGRQVGIVSHVSALNERVGAQVLVQKVGADKSVVTVEVGR